MGHPTDDVLELFLRQNGVQLDWKLLYSDGTFRVSAAVLCWRWNFGAKLVVVFGHMAKIPILVQRGIRVGAGGFAQQCFRIKRLLVIVVRVVAGQRGHACGGLGSFVLRPVVIVVAHVAKIGRDPFVVIHPLFER
jgi:hypothetical protein